MDAGTGMKTPREVTVTPPGIEHNHTFESGDSHDEVEQAKPCHDACDAEEPSSSLSPAVKEKSSSFLEVYQVVDSSISNPTWYDHVAHVSYISVFGVFGTVFRIYVGRFFGLDCGNDVHSNEDFLSGLSNRICVTTNGKTSQTGGALFTDLPANMIGSFLMGLVSPAVTGHPLVWFRPDHPLQQHDAFHTALKVGFCGCLTTFASWNTQMVVMLDGSDTALGPQVAAALFGFIIGVCCAVSSFLCGRHVYDFWRTTHPVPEPESLDAAVTPVNDDNDSDSDVERPADAPAKSDMICRRSSWYQRIHQVLGVVLCIRIAPFALLAAITAAFVVGDAVDDSLFYRKMWMCVLLSPPGALLRWYLAKYNNRDGPWERFRWIPWGTLLANLVAVVVSVIAEALEDRYGVPGAPGYAWIAAALPAVETGFAGSLSTVSTVVREMVDMNVPTHSYLYVFGSLILSMLLGLLFYGPLMRF